MNKPGFYIYTVIIDKEKSGVILPMKGTPENAYADKGLLSVELVMETRLTGSGDFTSYLKDDQKTMDWNKVALAILNGEIKFLN